MGRSVWTHRDSIENVYFHFTVGYCPKCEMQTDTFDFNCPECGGDLEPTDDWGDSWDWLVDDIRETLRGKFPSFQNADHWPEHESHCIAENSHCQIVISEYCGLVSLGVVPTGTWEAYYKPPSAFSAAWAAKNVVPFLRKTWGELRKIGTASNGESFFERAS